MSSISLSKYILFFFFSTISLHVSSENLKKLEENLGLERINFDVNEVLSDREEFEGRNVFISGLLYVDRDISLSEHIDAMAGGVDYLMVDEKYRNLLEPYDGCLVAVEGTFKKIYKDRDLFFLTNVSDVRRTGVLYLSAQGLMKKNGVEGEPKCLGKALIELMATPTSN